MHCVTERYDTVLTDTSRTGLSVICVGYTPGNEFKLDAIRDAFASVGASAREMTARFAQLDAELRRLEALSGHSEYVIHEEAEIFD